MDIAIPIHRFTRHIVRDGMVWLVVTLLNDSYIKTYMSYEVTTQFETLYVAI